MESEFQREGIELSHPFVAVNPNCPGHSIPLRIWEYLLHVDLPSDKMKCPMLFRVIGLLTLLFTASCQSNHEEERKAFDASAKKEKDARAIKIITPPKSPKIYLSKILEPTVIIKNEGTQAIHSARIEYFITLESKSLVFTLVPSTTWTGKLEPGETTEVKLKPFVTPLEEGTHTIRVFVNQVDGTGIEVPEERKLTRLFSHKTPPKP